MLESIRKIAHNPVFKIIFGVLILAFAVSGIAGMDFASSNNYAVKVGKAVITQEEIDARFQQMLLSMGPQAAKMSDEQLAAAGINKNQVVKNLVQGKIVAQEVADIGIVVGDDSVMKQIEKMPVFKGQDGKFSAERFKLFLEKMNMTEGSLKADMKNDLQNLILASSVLNNTPKNYFVAEEIAKAIKVKRDVEIVRIPANHVVIAANPTDEELKSFYFENSTAYQIPQKRDVTYVVIPKPDEADKAAFDKIGKVEDEIAGGSNITEIAKKFSLEAKPLLDVARTNAKFNELAFKTNKGQVSALIQNEDGSYLVLQVDNIHEAAVPDISLVKDKVVASWRAKKQADENIKFSQNILVALKDGKDFAQTAAANNVTFEKVVDFDAENKAYGDEFIYSVFSSAVGSVSGSIPDGKGGYIIAKTVAVKPQPVSATEINMALQQGGEIFQQEIFAQYMEYLQKKYPVKVNEAKAKPEPKEAS